MMDREFARTAYDAHQSLLRHYSEQIFKTRISIITLIVIFCAYLLGALPSQRQPLDPITSAVLAYLATILIALLFSIEIAYYRRFTQVLKAGRIIESTQRIRLYFSLWDHAGHWRLYSLYLAGMAFFITATLVHFSQSVHWNQYRALALATIIPIALSAWTLVDFSRIVKIALSPAPSEDADKSTLPLDRADD